MSVSATEDLELLIQSMEENASSHVCSQLANYLLYCKEKCPLHPIWFTWCMKIEDFMVFMLAKTHQDFRAVLYFDERNTNSSRFGTTLFFKAPESPQKGRKKKIQKSALNTSVVLIYIPIYLLCFFDRD